MTRPFAKGERVRHSQMPSMQGVVVRYYKPTAWPNGIVFWKGWDQFTPERMEWTWDYAMEKLPTPTTEEQ